MIFRHAMPAVDPAVPSRLLGLTESAAEDCDVLAEQLRERRLAGVIMASDEPKARETGTMLGLRLGIPIDIDPGFAEADRPYIDGDYWSLALQYVAGAGQADWESQRSVVARLGAAIARARRRSPEGDLVVVNHGLALTLFLASLQPSFADGRGGSFDPAAFWAALTFPDAWRFDPGGNRVTRLFCGGRPPPGP